MRVGVTGPRGRLGSALVALGCEPLDCDITNPEAVASATEGLAVVINAAAYTDVDGAEADENQERAIKVNTRGPGILRTNFSGYLIHLSTGYVFDGQGGPYDEKAIPSPVQFYGMTKLGGEAAAQMRNPTLVVRTLDLFGPGPSGPATSRWASEDARLARGDFVRRCRDLLLLGREVEAPTNQYVTPTWLPHLAEALLWLADHKFNRGPLQGVLNVAGDATISRYAWVRTIAEAFRYDPALVVPSDKRWGIAVRPLRGGLLTDAAHAMGVPIHSAVEGLQLLREAGDGDT